MQRRVTFRNIKAILIQKGKKRHYLLSSIQVDDALLFSIFLFNIIYQDL